jgi:hypothetical protein
LNTLGENEDYINSNNIRVKDKKDIKCQKERIQNTEMKISRYQKKINLTLEK